MPTTRLTGTLIKSGSIPTTALGGGVVTSSAQVAALSPSGTVSSSAQVKTLLPVGTVTSSAQYPGWVTASSQIDYNSITNKLSGVVSSSTQITPLLPNGTVSSSAQYPGWVTASSQIDYNSITNKLSGVYSSSTQAVAAIAGQTIAPATVNATNILSGSVLQTGTNALIGGKLAVTGSTELTGTVTASNLTANQAVFTNASDGLVSNAITGTGNVVMSASPTLTGTVTAANITANGTLLLQNIVSQSSAPTFTGLTSTGTVLLAGIYSSSAQTVAAIASQTIAPTTVNATSILSGSVLQTGTNALIGGKLAVTGSTELTGTVTASNLTANQAVFTNASDGLVSNAITGTGNVVMSASPTLTGTLTAANITATGTMLLAGIFSSSAQVDYNSIQNKLSGVVSSSGQVQPLLPGGTVSSSAQYPGWVTASSQIALNSITGTTFATADFTFPQNLTVAGNLTAQQFYTEFVSASVIYESGSTKFGNTTDDVMSVTGSIAVLGGTISGSMVGMFSSSAQVDYNNIQNKLSGVYSSSTQAVAAIAGQTIAPTTVNATNITASALTANQAVFTNASDGLVSNAITGTGNVVMSASPTLTGTLTAANITATGTMLLAGIVSQSSQIDYNSITNKLSGVYSSSAITAPSQGTVRLTLNGSALSDVDTGLQSNDRPLFSGSQFSGIVSGSGTEYRLVVPVGTNFYAT